MKARLLPLLLVFLLVLSCLSSRIGNSAVGLQKDDRELQDDCAEEGQKARDCDYTPPRNKDAPQSCCSGLECAPNKQCTPAAGPPTTETAPTPQPPPTSTNNGAVCGDPCIVVDKTVRYQTFYGLGASITGSTAEILKTASAELKNETLQALFSRENGIALNILRQPMGTSDFRLNEDYSYLDSETNVFSIEEDKEAILPAIRDAMTFNPGLKVMAVPWSAPAFLKTSGSLYGGSLLMNATVYDTMGDYFVNFTKAYREYDVPIWALSVQNEPQHESSSYPTMLMSAAEHAKLVTSVSNALVASGFSDIKIVAHDHNWDMPTFVSDVLGNEEAKTVIDAIAFHCYAGDVSVQSTIKEQLNPMQEVFFTECTESGDAFFEGDFRSTLRTLVIGSTRHWASTVLEWNLILDETNGPKIAGGCDNCRGLLNVDSAGGFTFSPAYYAFGHLSKFVHDGAVRIDSTETRSLKTVAMENPDGTALLVLLNDSRKAQTMNVQWYGMICQNVELVGFSAATLVHKGTNTVEVWSTHARCCNDPTLLQRTDTLQCVGV